MPSDPDLTVTIKVQPCEVTGLTESGNTIRSEYSLGDSDLSEFADFNFVQAGDSCGGGYTQTYTLSTSPNDLLQYLVKDDVAKTIAFDSTILSQTTNEALIGEYTVTVTATVNVPQSADDPSTTTAVSKSKDFTLKIQPCRVGSV